MGVGKDRIGEVVALANERERLRERMEGWSAVVQFELEGEEKPFHIAIHDKKMKLKDGAYMNPDMVVRGKSEDLARVASGDISISHPVARGEMRVVKGDYLELIRLERIITGARKRG